jgi:hypothetical protein
MTPTKHAVPAANSKPLTQPVAPAPVPATWPKSVQEHPAPVPPTSSLLTARVAPAEIPPDSPVPADNAQVATSNVVPSSAPCWAVTTPTPATTPPAHCGVHPPNCPPTNAAACSKTSSMERPATATATAVTGNA